MGPQKGQDIENSSSLASFLFSPAGLKLIIFLLGITGMCRHTWPVHLPLGLTRSCTNSQTTPKPQGRETLGYLWQQTATRGLGSASFKRSPLPADPGRGADDAWLKEEG